MFIRGMGHYVPQRILDNDELSTMVDTNDEWIRTRTGIRQRRIAAEGESCSDLAYNAAVRALASAGLDAGAVTHIIVCTVSGDAAFPATATTVQKRLGIENAMSFDLGAACSGFLYGLELARGLLALDARSIVLLVGAEVLSHFVDWQDRGTCVLFGDGAGAAVLAGSPSGHPGACNAEIEGVLCEGSAEGGDLLYCFAGGTRRPFAAGDVVGPDSRIHMNGREVFKLAVRAMSGVSLRLLDKLHYGVDDIDLVVPHQANSRIIQGVLNRVGIGEEKAFLNLDKYGNTSAASIPLALSEALEQGAIRPGMRVLLSTFGAGLSWSAAVLRF